MAMPPTVELGPGACCVRIIDQTLLPGRLEVLELRELEQIAEAIERLRVRGAPAIGCAAAAALAVVARQAAELGLDAMKQRLEEAADRLARTRPTAVNLFWAIDLMRSIWRQWSGSADELADALEQKARWVIEDDLQRCRSIGRHGAELVPDGANILTHCNAGGLATAGYGTALGVIRAAHEQGKRIHVWVDETRPLLQGARLTAFELMQDGIPCTVICDNMAASLMAAGRVDLVVVGADRIARNGDVANKIGTYNLAVLCRHHGVEFYVAAPLSTFDPSIASGAEIPIEQRKPDEVSLLAGFGKVSITPEGAQIYNPAFDVTPAELVSAIITERGVIRPPYEPAIEKLMGSGES